MKMKSMQAKVSQRIGRLCIFREKGMVIPVRLCGARLDEDGLRLALEPVAKTGFSSCRHPGCFEVGGHPEYLRITPGAIALTGYVSWCLITDEAAVERLINFARTKPDVLALIEAVQSFQRERPRRPSGQKG